MGIIIEISDSDDDPVVVDVSQQGPVTVVDNSAQVEVTNNTDEVPVIEVTRGLPGVQNVYVGDTPPNNPQEGWIWIDLSG